MTTHIFPCALSKQPHLLFVMLVCAGAATAQETKTDSSSSKVEPAPFLDDAKKYVIESVKNSATLKLNEKSLLKWTNPTRYQEQGAVYVWTFEDRPLAIGSFFTTNLGNRMHEFHSLATTPLRASFDGTLAWTPSRPGIEWKTVDDAPAPASNRVSRQLQMRQVARRFRAQLTSPDGEKTELRLAPRPLLEYASPKSGVSDGALFSFLVATDPEVLLLLEAFEDSAGTGFQYAFARFHYWDVAAFDGDKKVWSASLDRTHETNYLGDRGNIEKTYNCFHAERAVGRP